MSTSPRFRIQIRSHGRDLPAAERLAHRLREANIPAEVLNPSRYHSTLRDENSVNRRILILLMSPNLFDRSWPKLERCLSGEQVFNDPSQLLLPVILEQCTAPESIRRYRFIDWVDEPEEGLNELIRACNQVIDSSSQVKSLITEPRKRITAHNGWIWSLAIRNDLVVTASADGALKRWDMKKAKCVESTSQASGILSAAIMPDGARVITASRDSHLSLYESRSLKFLRKFRGHKGTVFSVAVMPDGRHVLSGSADRTIKVWNVDSGSCIATLTGHTDAVRTVIVLDDGNTAVSGGYDKTIRVWDLKTQRCHSVLEGHTDYIMTLGVASDNRVVSGSTDATVKIWDLSTRSCVATFEGHTQTILGLDVTNDGLIATASSDGTIRIWKLATGSCLQTYRSNEEFFCVAMGPGSSFLLGGSGAGNLFVFDVQQAAAVGTAQTSEGVRYTNAKIVLLGESGVGKSGLGFRLAESRWQQTDSTHGMKVWPLELPPAGVFKPDGAASLWDAIPYEVEIDREAWLWDLAGQADYRLIHQLFLDETSLALVLVNAQSTDPFKELGDWESALRMAVRGDPNKILVVARSDRGGAVITEGKIRQFCKQRGYLDYFVTSAKLNIGCAELKQGIAKYIPWDRLPWTATTQLFRSLKEALVQLKERGAVLVRFPELRQWLQVTMPEQDYSEDELRAVVGLVAGQGLIKRLDFGDFVLLQPEQLNNYASAVILNAREHIDGIGCIKESDVLKASFDFRGMDRLSKADEEILLPAMVQTFLEQSLCIRENTPEGEQLVFPSQFNRELEIPGHPDVLVTYRFSGHLATVYTTLVVRLSYSGCFEKKDLWKNAAEFCTPEGKTVGLAMNQVAEGIGEIKVFFDPGVPDDTRVTFIKYIHEHLLKRANDVVREREYACPRCAHRVTDREAIKERIINRRHDIVCVRCDWRIPLMDLIEQKFDKDRVRKIVDDMDIQANINLDNESRELILIGNMFAIAGESNQIFRTYSNSDHGIDGEIEFKDDLGRATGAKIYVQLKSGDSYLYERRIIKKRKKAQDEDTEEEILNINEIDRVVEQFTIKKERHISYWQNQAYPVYLVIRQSDGNVRWMNISDYLRTHPKVRNKVIFTGETLTPKSLLKIRKRSLETMRTGVEDRR